MCRAWGLKVWEDGARLLLPVWGRAGPGLCAARVTELRSQATCARTSASRGSAGEAGLSRWISLRPVKLAVKWSCGGTSPRVAHRLAVHRATPAVGISLLKWQLARRAGCCREAAGRVRAGLPAVGAPGCRLSAVGLSGLSRSSRLAFRQSGSCCNAFVTSKSRILWLRISG